MRSASWHPKACIYLPPIQPLQFHCSLLIASRKVNSQLSKEGIKYAVRVSLIMRSFRPFLPYTLHTRKVPCSGKILILVKQVRTDIKIHATDGRYHGSWGSRSSGYAIEAATSQRPTRIGNLSYWVFLFFWF
jgi:hypothetical protein